MKRFGVIMYSLAGAAIVWPASNVYAHEESTMGGQESIPWYTWTLLFFCVLTIAVAIIYARKRSKPEGRVWKGALLLAGTAACLMGAFNSAGMWEDKETSGSINLIHIHGIGYSDDGKQMLLATHDGIKKYYDEHWHEEGPGHDYMGFAGFEGGFYSSGHPEPGSALENPLGLVKSTDGGKTISILALHGVVDFHLMAVSYHKQTLYGYNAEPNTTLQEAGLYWTKDEGVSWSKSELKGFEGDLTAIAVHPDRPEVVALGSRNALFLSSDFGNNFEVILEDMGISALSFDRDGMLSVGAYKNSPSLLQLDPITKEQQEVPLPNLREDAISYTVHHPNKPQERVITTFEQDVFLTRDGGETWSQLADNGKTKPEPEIVPKLQP